MRSFQLFKKESSPEKLPYIDLINLQIKPLFQDSVSIRLSLLSIGIIYVTIQKNG